jgi:hypothetical protein
VLRDAGIDPLAPIREIWRKLMYTVHKLDQAASPVAQWEIAPIPTSSPFLTGCPPRAWRWPVRTVAIHRQDCHPSRRPNAGHKQSMAQDLSDRPVSTRSSDCRAMRAAGVRPDSSISLRPCPAFEPT